MYLFLELCIVSLCMYVFMSYSFIRDVVLYGCSFVFV